LTKFFIIDYDVLYSHIIYTISYHKNIILEYADKLKNGIKEEEKEWYFRFIHGTQKNKWSHHYCGYNKYRLIKMLEKHGFTSFENLPNQNFYPAVHVLAIK